jgi:hypothetical protein
MNDLAFDDLARRVARTSSLSRRSLLGALGVAGLSGVARPGLSHAQDATLATSPRRDFFDFEQIAFDLSYDARRLFDLVASGIDYDPYAGLLRGSRGALWALAGNSVDQSVLLAELMRAGLFRVRFAIGRLNDDAAARLQDVTRLTEAETLARSARQRLAPDALFLDAGLVAAPVAVSDAEIDPLEPLVRAAQSRDAIAKQHIDQTLELLTEALESAAVDLPVAIFQLPDLERTHHVWLQYASGAEWIDLDPSIPGARPGESFATPDQIVETIPLDLIHRVRVRVSVETASGDALVSSDALVHGVEPCPSCTRIPRTWRERD